MRQAGRRALASGATALFPRAPGSEGSGTHAEGGSDARDGDEVLHSDQVAEASTRLLEAAEDAATGVCVRPQRGAACVFWTMGTAGVDASTWHNGARVANGGGGKWIAQMFKEMPAEFRTAVPLALPRECPPPPFESHHVSSNLD